MNSSTFSFLKQKRVEPQLSAAALIGVMDTKTSTSNALMEGTLRRGAIKSDLKERSEIVPTYRNTSVPAAKICLKTGQDNVIS